MAKDMVLCHCSQRHKVGGFPRVPLRPSVTVGVLDRRRTELGPAGDVPILQNRIRELLERDINLVSIIQVMLIRRMLLCQRRPLRMWEFNPEGPRTVKHFFGLKLEEMCKLFFGQKVECPDTTEDAGLSCNRLDAQVSNLKAGHFIYIYHNYYSENPSVARNGSTRRRESGVRRHFLKARLVQPMQRCLAGHSAKSPQGKAKERAANRTTRPDRRNRYLYYGG